MDKEKTGIKVDEIMRSIRESIMQQNNYAAINIVNNKNAENEPNTLFFCWNRTSTYAQNERNKALLCETNWAYYIKNIPDYYKRSKNS